MFFFFFQAEDGIRDDLVTGVQTCALPILSINVVMHIVFDDNMLFDRYRAQCINTWLELWDVVPTYEGNM